MSMLDDPANHGEGFQHERHELREHRRRRIRRHGRRAFLRSFYSLPSLATLGNAICGFGAVYVAGLDPNTAGRLDHITRFFAEHRFVVAPYMIFLAMFFDAIDGRLARFTRHTTDFGGQLDSLADMVSFGVAPAALALQVFHDLVSIVRDVPVALTRLIWAMGALYMSCAAIRLARFNVSNEHGEQHHFSFQGLPSPGAAGAVATFILMQQDLEIRGNGNGSSLSAALSCFCLWALPVIVLVTGLLMVSNIRYPHIVNRYLRGRRSLGRVLAVLIAGLLVVVAHRYALAIGAIIYVLWGPVAWLYRRARPAPPMPPA